MQSPAEQQENPNAPATISIRILPRVHKKAKIQAAKEGRPLSEIYTDAIKMYLEAQ